MSHATQCPKCEGKGEVPLGDHLEEVLACFISRRSVRTADTIAGKLNITSGAASMRLMDLHLLGLLERERDGHYWRYSLA